MIKKAMEKLAIKQSHAFIEQGRAAREIDEIHNLLLEKLTEYREYPDAHIPVVHYLSIAISAWSFSGIGEHIQKAIKMAYLPCSTTTPTTTTEEQKETIPHES